MLYLFIKINEVVAIEISLLKYLTIKFRHSLRYSFVDITSHRFVVKDTLDRILKQMYDNWWIAQFANAIYSLS